MRVLALAAALAATASTAACTYGYDNPAQDLSTGEVVGRVVADDALSGLPAGVPGVVVELRNSYNLVTTRDTGRFFLFGMMPGRHTVLLSQAPDYALQRDVEMAWGKDGQPEGVILGDLRLRRAITLSGRVAAAPFPSYSAFVPTFAQVLDEETGQSLQVTSFTLDGTGSFESLQFSLAGAPTGRHRLRVAVAGLVTQQVFNPISGLFEPVTTNGTLVGGPIAVDVPESSEGLRLELNDLTVAFPAAADQGTVRFRAAVAGASYQGGWDASLVPLPVGSGATVVAGAPDSTGTFTVDGLPPGLYALSVLPTGASLSPPPDVELVVTPSAVTDLGTLYAVDPAATSGGQSACYETADCASGACVDGRCAVTDCLPGSFFSECSSALITCSEVRQPTPCANGAGFCGGTGSVDTVCVPKGQSSCTSPQSPTPSSVICGTPN